MVVIANADDISRVDFSKPIELFSQTTKDPVEYEMLADIRRSRGKDDVHDTICAQEHQTRIARQLRTQSLHDTLYQRQTEFQR